MKHILHNILESIRGSEQDYTQINLSKAILLLSIPMLLEMMMESLFAIVDIYYVSKLGSNAIATVGLTESIVTIVYAVGIGLSQAANAIISRRIGENAPKEASRTAWQAIIAGIIPSLFISIAGIVFAKDIIFLMGGSKEMIYQYSAYTQWILGGNIIIMLLFIINGIFRASGYPAISMKILFFANLLNIILDPLLIFGIGPFPKLGIEGAAIATNLGRALAVVYQFYLLFSKKDKIKIKIEEFSVNLKIIKEIIYLSLGTIGQHLIATSSWIFLMRLVSSYGANVIAGYTIALRIIFFSLIPVFGLSNAASTLVGQNLGANKPERASKSVFVIGLFSAILFGCIGLCLILFDNFWISLFSTDKMLILHGANSLKILSIGFISFSLNIIVISSINGAGDTFTPTILNVIFFWLTEIPLAYFLSKNFNLNENGVFYSIILSETFLAIVSIIIFRRGKWKKVII